MFGDPQAPADDAGDDETARLGGPKPETVFEADVIDEGDADERIASLIERAATAPELHQRVGCFLEAAHIYETELGEPDKALITLQAALAEDHGNEEAIGALGALADKLGKKGELLEEYASSVNDLADPAQKVALLALLARWHGELGEDAAAEQKLQQALTVDATAMPLIRALAARLEARGDWAALADHLARAGTAAHKRSDQVELLARAAELHHRRLRDSERATDLYSRVLELDSQSPAALEALSEIAWHDENWVKALPLLERLATLPERTAEERCRVHQRAALTALRTSENERARAHALALVELGSPDLTFLGDWLDIAVARQWWPDVGVIGPYIRDHADFSLPVSEQAELAARIGRSRLEAGDPAGAAEELEVAVRLDPNHRRAREQLAELRDKEGDVAAALEHKKRLAEGITAPEDRFRLLVEMARAERDAMNNPDGALEMLEEARTLQPEDRTILTELLDLYTDRKQWLNASEVLLSLAESEPPPARARYLVAAANILHYELGESEQALELYDKALDDDPTDLKSFERQDKILAARHDYKEQARAYRRMIKRVGSATDDAKKVTLLMLWRGLADVLRTHLGDHDSAVTAYEVCVQLDPDSIADREALAELCEAKGPDGLRQAVEQRTGLLEKSDDGAALVRQLRALRRMYHQAGLWDRVYNVCAALTVLQAADAEERGFYEQVAAGNLTLPQAALTEEVWQKVIYDPKEERRLSLLFSCVAPVVALARAQDAKAFGLKDRLRLEAASDPSGVARLFEYGAGVLSVQPPVLYLNPDFAGEAEIINLRDAVGAAPVVMISPNIVNGRVEKDVAFVVGRTLALTRADHLVLSRHVVPNTAELTAIVHAAFKHRQPSAPVPSSSSYEPYLQLFKKALPMQALEPLSSLVPWLIEHWRTVDVEGWRQGAERTADRAGLLLCGDLGAAVRVIHATRGMAAGPAVLDLVRWSVSEGHLGLRELLGVALAAAA